ncbi:hypothetical protein DVH24_009639, partial [Malus domestica]
IHGRIYVVPRPAVLCINIWRRLWESTRKPGYQYRLARLGVGLRIGLLLHGLCLGRLYLYNQLDSHLRFGAFDHRAIFHEVVCRLQLHLYSRNVTRYANSLCRLSARLVWGAHGCHGHLLLDAGVGGVALGVGTASGYISPWTRWFYSLLDPTYAKDHIPIIVSVSEHQPTAWSSFMFDFHILLFFFPVSLYFCFKRLSDATIFVVMYGLTSMYFAGVMVRLILVATPAVCLISAINVSATIKNLTQLARAKDKVSQTGSTKGASSTRGSSKHSCFLSVITSNFVHQHLVPSVGIDTKSYVGSLSSFSSHHCPSWIGKNPYRDTSTEIIDEKKLQSHHIAHFQHVSTDEIAHFHVLGLSHREGPLDSGPKSSTRVFDLAAQISADLSPFSEPPALVDVANNTFLFLADLAHQIPIFVTVDFIRAKSHGSGTLSSGSPMISFDLKLKRWISTFLEHGTVDDLLVLSLTYGGEMIFDLESMRKIISGFVEKEKSVVVCNTDDFREVLGFASEVPKRRIRAFEEGGAGISGGVNRGAVKLERSNPLEPFSGNFLFLLGNNKTLITVSNDKDLHRMIKFHGNFATIDVYIMEEVAPPDVSSMPTSK